MRTACPYSSYSLYLLGGIPSIRAIHGILFISHPRSKDIGPAWALCITVLYLDNARLAQLNGLPRGLVTNLGLAVSPMSTGRRPKESQVLLSSSVPSRDSPPTATALSGPSNATDVDAFVPMSQA